MAVDLNIQILKTFSLEHKHTDMYLSNWVCSKICNNSLNNKVHFINVLIYA